MKTPTEPGRGTPESGDALGELIGLAGRRETPPREAYDSVLAAASDAWRRKVRQRRRRRAVMAAAASVAVAAAAVGIWRTGLDAPGDGVTMLATTDRLLGTVEVLEPDETGWRTVVDAGVDLPPGTRLRTAGQSGAGLAMTDGESVRLAADTDVVFESHERLHLMSGALYVDSGRQEARTGRFEVVTPSGNVRHVGTQYEVLVRQGALRLRVREGDVLLSHPGGSLRASAGEEVTLAEDGRVSTSTVSRHGSEWLWEQALAPLPTGSQSVSTLLEWVERETGRSVHFVRPELEIKARQTMLHGDIRPLMPMEALAVMLQTTDFRYTVAGEDEILIEERRP